MRENCSSDDNCLGDRHSLLCAFNELLTGSIGEHKAKKVPEDICINHKDMYKTIK